MGRLNADGIDDVAHKGWRSQALGEDDMWQWFIYAWTIDGTNFDTYINGETNYISGADGATYTGNINPVEDDVVFGINCNMDVAEVLVYKRGLSESELTQVENYLQDKYNVQICPVTGYDGDFNGDCGVNLKDFSVITSNWLDCGYDHLFLCPDL